ncbi:MAG TPA: CehA/McbA family metallohydrolase [Kofleriaceae bacterium]|nr:CehA/McbA family metallohydrolase [Kofleriaceae bacterium]
MKAAAALLVASAGLLAACGGGDGGPGLADYSPELPPTGGAAGARAGAITDPGELVTGPAAQGQVGDFVLANAKVKFIVGAPTRVIGVVPQGGNVIDAVRLDAAGQPTDLDQFGELSMVYKAGRTCEHDRMEIVRDGSAGGPAVLRATGKSGNNDFINLKGIGALPVGDDIDPDVGDDLRCATTYVLDPDSDHLKVYWSLYNDGTTPMLAPFGVLADTGGETEAWLSRRGVDRAGIDAIGMLADPAPTDYVVYQAPGVAYGVIPRFDRPTPSAGFLVAGVSILLFGAQNLLDIFQRDTYQLSLPAHGGTMQEVDVVIGSDAEDVDREWRDPATLVDAGGRVTWSNGMPVAGARVGVFEDTDGNGALDDADLVLSYMDVAADGTYRGKVPAGTHFVRAEVKDQGRSPAKTAAASADLVIPAPVRLDFTVLDDATGNTIPARLLVIGQHPAFPDQRLFETYDRLDGVVVSRHLVRGISTGTVADEPIYLPAGGHYRVYASRGTEWSVTSAPFDGSADGRVTLRLRRVVDTTGYLAAEFHVHQVGSPDSPVGSLERVKSALSGGIELFAVTDHDVVSDLEPIVEDLAVDDELRVIPGMEITPFAYGHFNAYPLDVVPNATGGAIDWGRGHDGYAMTPGEIFAAARQRGARVVEVNHPRGEGALGTFQQFFDRANLRYDFTARSVFGDFQQTAVPNDWLRLPDQSLWSDAWNVLEVWNGFDMRDTDGDGRRENVKLDRVMRDWFDLLSLGFYVAPVGNSDTHQSARSTLGMPRTMVRVPDDGPGPLADGTITDAVMKTLEGVEVPRDLVVTDGPMMAVKVNGMDAIGRQVAPTAGAVTMQVTVTAADWADFDTIEVFANATPDSPVSGTTPVALVPLRCWTSRPLETLSDNDPCLLAPMTPQPMTVTVQSAGGNYKRLAATITVRLTAADIRNRAGATGQDAWVVFRARGDKAIFPILSGDLIDDTNLATLVDGDPAAVDNLLRSGLGVHAEAFTAPVFVDFDGNGYRAPFKP